MCGRFALAAPAADLIEFFDLATCEDFPLRYNIPPGTDIPVIRYSPEGQRVLHLLRWGLIPHWSKDPSIGNRLANARAESLTEKPAFREAFKKRRCLIPASGFYEWQAVGKIKQPYYIRQSEQQLLAMAGLWESWRAPDGSLIRSVCVITTEANDVMAPIHHRMPVIIAPDDWALWLSGEADEVQRMLRPFRGPMTAHPVDRRVSRPTEAGAALLETVSVGWGLEQG